MNAKTPQGQGPAAFFESNWQRLSACQARLVPPAPEPGLPLPVLEPALLPGLLAGLRVCSVGSVEGLTITPLVPCCKVPVVPGPVAPGVF